MTLGELGFVLSFDHLKYLSFLKDKTAETCICVSQTGQGRGKCSDGQRPEVEPRQPCHGGHLPVRWQHLRPAGHGLCESVRHAAVLHRRYIW